MEKGGIGKITRPVYIMICIELWRWISGRFGLELFRQHCIVDNVQRASIVY